MQVIEKGRPQKGWSVQTRCSGDGNGGGGCHAVLLVEQPDLYLTYSHARDETDTHVTFTCSECHVETDLKQVPGNIQRSLPSKGEWEQRKLNDP